MERLLLVSMLLLFGATAVVSACGSDDTSGSASPPEQACGGFGCAPDGGGACVGLGCQQVTCEGAATTSLRGVVRDPAGKVPIYNATVYVPNGPVAPFGAGVTGCDRCDAKVSGEPVVLTTTDTSGAFELRNVPVGDKIPLVIQIGKWRRQVVVPTVTRCVATPLDAALTRLPRSRAEGDLPRIAVSTGAADPLQCLLRKIGIDESEFGIAGSDARIHLFAGGGFDDDGTPRAASSAFATGASFPNAETLWASRESLSTYDVVMLACEGNENDTAEHKPASSKQALYDYATTGGRLFTTHFHHTFFSTSPDPAPRSVAQWTDKAPPASGNPVTTPIGASIVGTFPKAIAMKDWLTKQQALSDGKLPMVDARHNVDGVATSAFNWIEAKSENSAAGLAGQSAVQYLSFNAPVGAAEGAVCGRVVFTNLHVGAGTEGGATDDPTAPFPTSCATENLSAQQKALAFMLFDLSSCVQKDDAPIVGPR